MYRPEEMHFASIERVSHQITRITLPIRMAPFLFIQKKEQSTLTILSRRNRSLHSGVWRARASIRLSTEKESNPRLMLLCNQGPTEPNMTAVHTIDAIVNHTIVILLNFRPMVADDDDPTSPLTGSISFLCLLPSPKP